MQSSRWRLGALLQLLLAGSLLAATAPAPPSGLARGPVEPGAVRGFVLNAETGAYLPGAQVSYAPTSPGAQPSTATTGADGYYQVTAPLGTKRSVRVFSLRRSIWTNLLGARRTYKYVEVSQVVLSVSCAGYRSFHGPVQVAEGTANPYEVWLQPVRLAPEAVDYRSFVSAEKPGRVTGISCDKSAVAVNEAVSVAIEITGMASAPKAPQQAFCSSSSLQGPVKLAVAAAEPGIWVAKGSLRLVRAGLARVTVELPRPAELSAVFYLVAAAPGAGRDALAADVATVNAKLPAEGDPAVASLRTKAASLPERAADEAAWGTWAEAFKKGDYAAASTAQKGVKYTTDREKHLSEALKQVRAVAAKPDNVKAFAAYAKAVEQFLAEPFASEPQIHEALKTADFVSTLRSPQVPTCPPLASAAARLSVMDSLEALGRPAEALDMAAKMVADSSLKASPQQLLDAAEVLLAGRQQATALPVLEKLATDPQVGLQAKVHLANLRFDANDPQAAEQLYAEALATENRKKVSDGSAYSRYAQLLLRKGDWAAAPAIIELALSNARDNISHAGLAPGSTVDIPFVISWDFRFGVGRGGAVGYTLPEAPALQLVLSHLDLVEHPDQDWQTASTTGAALARLGAGGRALDLCAQAAAARADDETVIANLAVCQLLCGERDAAETTLGRLRRLNPRHPALGTAPVAAD